MEIIVQKGDLTALAVDAIVNPANSHGWMGGGVAGAIKRRGGIEIEEEAVRQAPISIGEAVVTRAGSLPSGAVIHAPTMKEPAERTDIGRVRLAMGASLRAADENRFSSIAVPGMGTGVGCLSPKDAAEVMVDVARSFKAKYLKKIVLVGIDDKMVQAFSSALTREEKA
ncbi:MAG: macro domain-containing protein [Candidatus Omnitrophica bacterium]|nr:macro domain-containing protein [Candidatus Omnitrophota bacterium]